MRIALVTSEFLTENLSFDGGLSNYIFRLALALQELGHEPVVLVASHQQEILDYKGIEVHRVKSWYWEGGATSNLWAILANYLSLRFFRVLIYYAWQSYSLNNYLKKLHKQQQFDIVQYAHLGGTAFFLDKTIPSVVRLSSSTSLCQQYGGYGYSDWQAKQQIWIENKALQKVDAIFGPSRAIAKIVKQEINREISIIETPFVLDKQQDDPSSYQHYLANKKYLLFFGSLSLIKGTDLIADILEKILAQYPELYFVFVGKDSHTQQGRSMVDYIFEKAKSYQDRVIRLDKMPHPKLYPIIEKAYGVVLPSRIDNFPNTCIEAMAHKKIVIGTKNNGFEQLIQDKKNGFLIDIQSSSQLLESCKELLNLPPEKYQQMGQAAYERILELKPEKVVRQLLKFYEDIVNN